MASSRRAAPLPPPHPVLTCLVSGSTPANPAPEPSLSPRLSPPLLGAAEGVYVFGVWCIYNCHSLNILTFAIPY